MQVPEAEWHEKWIAKHYEEHKSRVLRGCMSTCRNHILKSIIRYGNPMLEIGTKNLKETQTMNAHVQIHMQAI